MARKPDPTRKPALIQLALEFLIDKPLSSLTLRSLARALEVSTFTLVYHFGSRTELVREIIRANARGASPEQARLLPADTLDAYISSITLSWRWTQLPENLYRQRLELEAMLLDAVEGDEGGIARIYFEQWVSLGTEALVVLGVERGQAEVESRLLVNTFQGMQLDLVLNEDSVAASAVFDVAVNQHRQRIEALMGEVAR